MPSPRPKPTALKIADGSAAKNPQKINKKEPPHSSAAPEPPGHLEGAALAEWWTLCKWLGQLGILSETYTRSMAAYCEAYAKYLEVLERVKAEGVIVGESTRNPANFELQRYADQCLKYLQEFGLTPSAKTKIVSDIKESELGRFFG